jgi:hypothetical protein
MLPGPQWSCGLSQAHGWWRFWVVTGEFWLSVTLIIVEAAGRRCLMGKVVSHMTMSLDGFVADPDDGVAELFRLV